MALITRIQINDCTIYTVEARRIQGTDQPDAINLYQVKVFGEQGRQLTTFHVKHRYGDGALALTRRVLDVVADIEKEKVS